MARPSHKVRPRANPSKSPPEDVMVPPRELRSDGVRVREQRLLEGVRPAQGIIVHAGDE